MGVLLRGDQRIRGKDGYRYASGDDAGSVDPARTGRLHILECQRLIRFMPKVVICVVPGWAAGGGHSLHVVCDLTLASREHARFKQTDVAVASFDGGFGSAYLARQVGQKLAREIFFLGREYTADDYVTMGAANLAVPHDDLEVTALEWAAEINAKSPTARRMLKYAFNLIDDGLVGQQLFAGEATRLAYASDEAAEGRDAFLAKRDPDWADFPTVLRPPAVSEGDRSRQRIPHRERVPLHLDVGEIGGLGGWTRRALDPGRDHRVDVRTELGELGGGHPEMVGALHAGVSPHVRPAFVRVPPLLDAGLLGPIELVEHQPRCVACRGALFVEGAAFDGDPARNPPPPSLPARPTARILLDEAVLLQLAEVIARRPARFVESGGELRRRRRSVDAELVAQLHPQRMGETLQRRGIENAIRRCSSPSACAGAHAISTARPLDVRPAARSTPRRAG